VLLAEIHIKEIIMPNASVTRAHLLLQLRRGKSEEFLILLIHILSQQQVSFIKTFNDYE
jgi:hypothetical protein